VGSSPLLKIPSPALSFITTSLCVQIQAFHPAVSSAVVQLIEFRRLETVNLGVYRGLSRDLPLALQPIFEAYFILNTVE
jgi:hypothetical protein